MRFYIIRHGETDWNNLGKIQGRIDNPLNETGFKQAHNISCFFETIKPTHLVTSPLIRAKQTMDTIINNNNWDLTPIIDDNFIERDFGELEGKQGEDFYQVSDFNLVKNYETDEIIQNRTLTGLNKYTNDINNTVIITCHSHTIRSILIGLFPDKFKWDESSKLKNCAIVELEYYNNDYKLIDIH